MSSKNTLGKLKSLGIKSEAHVALYLPEKHLDLRRVVTDAYSASEFAQNGHTIAAVGKILARPNIESPPKQQSRARITLAMSDGSRVAFTLFEVYDKLVARLDEIMENAGQDVLVAGIPLIFGQTVSLNNATLLPIEYAGKIIPVYKGKPKVMKPDTAREQILSRLENSIPQAAQLMRDGLADYDVSKIVNLSKLEMIIREAHFPTNMKYLERANEILNKLAAVVSKQKLQHHFKSKYDWLVSARIDASRWADVAANIEFELTGEQVQIITEAAQELAKAVPMRGMVQGDVGSGKTAVYGTLAITAALQGKNVAVILPNTALAIQVYEELKSWVPQSSGLEPQLVLGSTDESMIQHGSQGKLIIGTTAVLFRDVGEMDFVCVDEQQKFSRQQREQLVSGKTHLLEISATPIPRSVALVKYGAMKVWRLTKNHTKKEIVSSLITGKKEAKRILHLVKETVNKGNQAIIVYALKDESEAMEGIVSANQAYEKWSVLFPGKVRLVHSNMSEEEKGAALGDMKSEEASILISTTVIEVGVTIPGVMVLAVANAERFGLVSLHQLRGRVARKGSRNGQIGEFIMQTKENPSKNTLNRLQVMLETNDGYVIAEKDTQLRGFGDLGIDSETQTGADESILVGRKIDLELLEEVL